MNQSLFTWFHNFAGRSPILDVIIIFFAEQLPYLLVVGAIYLIFKTYKDWRVRFAAFGETVLAILLSRGIITELIRFLYHHPRPFDALQFTSLIPESSYSFPSGHAAFFFALALVVFFINRTWGVWYLVFSIINGISRVIAGVHWPFDILGGLIVGIVSAYLIHSLLKSSTGQIQDKERQQHLPL